MKPSLVITYPSSLYFWRHTDGRSESFRLVRIKEAPPVSNVSVLESDIEEIKSMLNLTGSVSLLGTKKVPISAQNKNYYYVRKTFLPPNSIFLVRQQSLPMNIYIASPEYSFLKAADDFSFEKLVELAYNLSAIYYTNLNAEFGQLSRKPITSVEKLSEYLASAKASHGIKNATRAIQYALNNSNSPMESKLDVLSVFPFAVGGYGLPTPEPNGEVKLSSVGTKILGRDTCRGDIVWREKRVILEYDSNMTHLSPEQHAYDKRRQNALTASGYKVITATADDIRNLNSLDALFKNVRKALGLKACLSKYDKYRERRFHVVKELFRK